MRARFSVGEIQAQALKIVDRDGLAKLSMRSLGAELGTGAMTLYNYVSDRDDLEEIVVAAVLSDVTLPRRKSDWLADVKAVAHALWEGMRRHPNAIPLILTRRTASSASYQPAERLIDSLRRGDLSDLDLLAAFRGVLSLVMGAAQVELAWPSKGIDRDAADMAAASQIGALAGREHPSMAQLAQVSTRSTMSADFDRALDMLLVGIRASSESRLS